MGRKREETLNCFSPSMYAHFFFALFSFTFFTHGANALPRRQQQRHRFIQQRKKKNCMFVCVCEKRVRGEAEYRGFHVRKTHEFVFPTLRLLKKKGEKDVLTSISSVHSNVSNTFHLFISFLFFFQHCVRRRNEVDHKYWSHHHSRHISLVKKKKGRCARHS